MPGFEGTIRCLVVDDEFIAREILVSLIEKTPSLSLVDTVDDAFKAMSILNEKEVDLVFLDVEMPGMSGLDMLKGLDGPPAIILTTSHADYAVEAFDLNVLDFLLKPIDPGRFMKAVNRAIKSFQKIDKGIIYLKQENAYVKIDLKSVLYMEAYGDYVKVYDSGGRHVFRAKMKELEDKLPENFIRVHRSYIINLNKVNRYEDMQLFLGDRIIPVAKSHKSRVLNKLNIA